MSHIFFIKALDKFAIFPFIVYIYWPGTLNHPGVPWCLSGYFIIGIDKS